MATVKDDPTNITDVSYEGLVIENPLTVGISRESRDDAHIVSAAARCGHLVISGGRACIYIL